LGVGRGWVRGGCKHPPAPGPTPVLKTHISPTPAPGSNKFAFSPLKIGAGMGDPVGAGCVAMSRHGPCQSLTCAQLWRHDHAVVKRGHAWYFCTGSSYFCLQLAPNHTLDPFILFFMLQNPFFCSKTQSFTIFFPEIK